MCGISGYFSSKPLSDSRMLHSQNHRGPDDRGSFVKLFGDRKLCLIHNRLSILDLSARGRQPMHSADGNVVIIFNGEIYNYKSLKEKYFRERVFKSGTDTEVVLELFALKGMDFIKELNGDFAMAVLDQREEKLYLFRDRMGVKPLYYFHSDAAFVFGSEIKSITASGIKPVLNEEEILNYFVFKYSPLDRTLFKDIRRVDPGSFLELNLRTNGLTARKYWEPVYAEKQISYEEAKLELKDLLGDAIRLRLLSDVPVGNFLSGGLDSTIIAYFLKEEKAIKHFCARKEARDIKAEGTSADYYYAERLARDWGIELQSAPIGSSEANSDLIRDTLRYSDDLIADGSQIPSYMITRAAARDCRVMLSGMGADELFLGYAGHMLTLLSSRYLSRLPSGMVNSLAGINQGKGFFLAYRRYLHKLGKYNQLPPYRYALFNIVGDFENSASVYQGNKDGAIEIFNAYFKNEKDVFENLFHFERQNFLVKNLHYLDRMSMANSVESRVPYLDHRLVEFAAQLPLQYKISPVRGFKRILKDSFRKELPPYILSRRKAGFGMPLRSIFSDRQKVQTLLDTRFFANFRSFSAENIGRIIGNHISGKEDNSSIIYALVSFQEWYKLNF